MGTSTPVMRSGGASRKSKAPVSVMTAWISAPTPLWGQPSSTVIRREVLRTDLSMESRSRGRIVRRLITSAEMPLASSSLAASRATPTMRLNVTMVTSVPSRSTLALPISMTKSSRMASSLISNSTPYMSSFSSMTTGLSSRMAALSRPLASSEFHGDTTLRPGQWLYQEAKHCECWAATPAATPLGPRNTMGTLMSPADMYSCLAAELIT
mmetsp:Transcript_9279/g.36263  ORF Transcript_9279/g.36263 Transcript_9279/m.36263 type:complete len:211 (-) Transcript_9279:414-1046(-)